MTAHRSQESQIVQTATQAPWWTRINVRLMVLALVVLVIPLYIGYVFFSEALSGGIHDRGRFVEVNLKAISNFEMDQQAATMEDIPRAFRELDGRRVRVVGEMWAPQEAGGTITSFQLVYSIAKCCFSGPPKVQHFVDATVMKDANMRVDLRRSAMVRVTGIFHVKIKREADHITSVYQLDAESVESVY